MARTDQRGIPFKYSLPTSEHDAMERVGQALGITRGAAVVRAVSEYIRAGFPRDRIPPPAGEVPRDQLCYYAAVCWWLRRSPAVEILAPAALLEEARLDELERHDPEVMRRTLLQIHRIAADGAHPLNKEAFDLLLSAVPESERARLVEAVDAARLAASFGASVLAPKGKA